MDFPLMNEKRRKESSMADDLKKKGRQNTGKTYDAAIINSHLHLQYM